MPETISPPNPIAPPAVAPTPKAEYRFPPTTASGQKDDPISRAVRDRLEAKHGAQPAAAKPAPQALAPDAAKEVPHGTPAPAPEAKPPAKFAVPDEAPPAAPAAVATASDEPPPEVLKSASAQLKEVYEKVKAQRDDIMRERDLTKKEATEYRTRLKTFEDRIKSLEGADTRAKDLEQRLLANEEKLRISAYTQTDEFHTQYVKPVAEATQNAHALVKELLVTTEDGSQRMGSIEDFYAVLGQPNHTTAKAKARALFGEDFATEVFEAARRVREAQQRQSKAMESAALKSQEWVKAQSERDATQRTQLASMFQSAIAGLAEKHPGLYTPAEKDEEAVAARTKGEELANLILHGRPDAMPMEEYVANASKAYQRAASWPLKELAIHRLTQELEATKAKLAAYEKSSPDTDSAKRPGGITEIGGTPVNAWGKVDRLSQQMHESLTRRANKGR